MFNIQNNARKLLDQIYLSTESSPKKYKFEMVQELKLCGMQVLKNIIWANQKDRTDSDRLKHQKEAINYLIYFNELLIVCKSHKCLTEHQFEFIIDMSASLKDSIENWIESDKNIGV